MDWVSWLFWWRPPCLLRRVTLNFVHGDSTEALEGVLWRSRGPWLVLQDVTALKAGQQPVAMVGEIVIHRSQVAFFQVTR